MPDTGPHPALSRIQERENASDGLARSNVRSVAAGDGDPDGRGEGRGQRREDNDHDHHQPQRGRLGQPSQHRRTGQETAVAHRRDPGDRPARRERRVIARRAEDQRVSDRQPSPTEPNPISIAAGWLTITATPSPTAARAPRSGPSAPRQTETRSGLQ